MHSGACLDNGRRRLDAGIRMGFATRIDGWQDAEFVGYGGFRDLTPWEQLAVNQLDSDGACFS